MAFLSVEKKAKKLIKSWYKLTKNKESAIALALWEAEHNMHFAKCKLKAFAVVVYLRELVSNQNKTHEKMYYTNSTPVPTFSDPLSTDSQGSLS